MGKRSNASKFPVARIKKMMQADEDIGKVAQATPVVICECQRVSARTSFGGMWIARLNLFFPPSPH